MDDNEKFYANPRCVLHVAPADSNVEDRGNWAELKNGLMFARVRVGTQLFCHACAEDSDKLAPRQRGDTRGS